MVKLYNPDDSSQSSLRDKFPILSSITEQPVDHSSTTSTKTRQSSQGINHAKNLGNHIQPLNRSKSLFSLAQSFFKLKVDDHLDSNVNTEGPKRPRPSRRTSAESLSVTGLRPRDPLCGDKPARQAVPKPYGTWNPLASIRGKLDGSFFSVRGRRGPAVSVPPEFDAGVGSPMKRRKSLHGLHDAWGTVGKKFTLRGRKRGQAEAALSAYRLETHEDIELPDLGLKMSADGVHRIDQPLPSKGLPTRIRVTSVDQDSIGSLEHDGHESGPKPITIAKSTNSKKRHGGDCTSDIRSCSPKTRSSNKHVAFASATQLRLMEEAKERQRITSRDSDASGCPSLGSAGISENELAISTPSVQLERECSAKTSMGQLAEKTLAEEQAEMDLIEKLLDDSASFRSVDLDVFHENRRSLRQARYDMLMDPVQQVKNFEVFTQVVENTQRMLSNIGHGDVEALSRGSSFAGPVYTWTNPYTLANRSSADDTYKAGTEPDCHRQEGEGGVISYHPEGFQEPVLQNHYDQSVVTVVEVFPDSDTSTPTTPLKASNAKIGPVSFSDFVRGRALWRTPTQSLAVNNRSSSRSPLKRFDVKLSPNTAFHRLMETGSPSSTTAIRCPSAEPTRGLTDGESDAHSETDWANFDLSYLSIADKENEIPIRGGAHPGVSADLEAFQASEAQKFRRENNISDASTEYVSTVSVSPAQSSVFDGLITPAYTPQIAAVDRSPSPGKAKSFEQLELELLAFQAEEEAKFKKGKKRALRRKQAVETMNELLDSDEENCCQYWRSCQKVGTCFKDREKESMTLTYRREWRAEHDHNMEWKKLSSVRKEKEVEHDHTMDWKKRHWVEGYSCTKRSSTASEEKTDSGRDSSFTFLAHGKRVRMATYGGSSFFVKTSYTPVTGPIWKSMGQQQPMRKGNAKRPSCVSEDEVVLGDTPVTSSTDELHSLNGSKYSTFDNSLHTDSMFTFPFSPKGFTTANPSDFSSSSGAMSPKTFNNYGNIVRCWSPPDLPSKASAQAAQRFRVENIDTRPKVGTARIFDTLEWPPAKQDFLRSHYSTSQPGLSGPRQQQERNVDSGYWDAEKQAMIVSAPASESSREDEAATAPPQASSPHGTAAHMLSRLDEWEASLDVDAQYTKLAESLAKTGKINSVKDICEHVSALFALDTSKKMDKGKGKAPVPPLPPSGASNYWRGKSQEWPIESTFPTFIALEPAATGHKDQGKAPAEAKRKVTPNLCVQTRNITPQATINGKGPVSPLTKAWLESKKGKDDSMFDFQSQPGLKVAAGNKRHFYANVTGDGKAVGIPPIRSMKGGEMRQRGIRPSLAATERTVSAVSAVTMVDETFGEELVDFRSGEGGEMVDGEEMVGRVPGWMLYG